MENVKKKHPILILLLCLATAFSFIPVANLLGMFLSALLAATNAGWLKWLLQAEGVDRFDSLRCLVMIIPAVLIYRRLRKKSEPGTVHWSLAKGSAYGILAGVGFNGISFLWIQFAEKFLSGIEWIRNSLGAMNGAALSGEKLFWLLLAAGILVPLLEELLFRGIIFSLLEKIKKGWFAVIVSALLFALAHISPVQIVYTFIMGLISGLIYYKTKDLRWTILMHMVINILSTFAEPEYMHAYLSAWNLFTVVMIVPVVFLVAHLLRHSEKKA